MGGVCAGSGAGADGLQCRELSALWQRQRRQYSPEIDRPAVESAELQFAHLRPGTPLRCLITSGRRVQGGAFPDQGPQAYDNLRALCRQAYYNGLTFSRVESGFVVEAGQGADGRGNTIWNGSRYPAETTDSLHHYSGACVWAPMLPASAPAFFT